MGMLVGVLLLAGLFVAPVHALDCPKMPEQARKDWQVEVKSAVGKIGPVIGAELATATKAATLDLMGRVAAGG